MLLERDESFLLIVDVQEKLAPAVLEPSRVVANVIRLVKSAQRLDVPVLMTEHCGSRIGPLLPDGRSRMSTSYSKPSDVSAVRALISRWLNRAKYRVAANGRSPSDMMPPSPSGTETMKTRSRSEEAVISRLPSLPSARTARPEPGMRPWHGGGANGKSTFLETVRALLGTYVRQADFSTLLVGQAGRVRNLRFVRTR